MIAHVWTRIIPTPSDGWNRTGFDLPRFLLDSGDGINAFTTLEQAAMIATDVALYGRPVGTIANMLLATPEGETFTRFYRVNDNGRLSSVPETELDENGIPFAVYLRTHTS